MSPSNDDDGDVDELQDGNTAVATVVVITIHRHFSVNPSPLHTHGTRGRAICGERKAIKTARQILKLNIKEEEKF